MERPNCPYFTIKLKRAGMNELLPQTVSPPIVNLMLIHQIPSQKGGSAKMSC